MINFKQRELCQMIFDKLKFQFPELEFLEIHESPENPNSLWLRVLVSDNEDREFEVREMASELSADIHLQYGYHILVMPTTKEEKIAA